MTKEEANFLIALGLLMTALKAVRVYQISLIHSLVTKGNPNNGT